MNILNSDNVSYELPTEGSNATKPFDNANVCYLLQTAM